MSEAAVPNPNPNQPETTQIQPTQLRSTDLSALSAPSDATNASLEDSDLAASDLYNEPISGTDDGWTTVTFPQATSIDTLLGAAAAESVTLNGMVNLGAGMEPTELGARSSSHEASFKELQQHNQELRVQVTQLETALSLSQSALREEMERWETLALAQPQTATDQVELIQQHNQELSKAQGRIRDLFQELERSHQTAQKQQILVETLTEQLQTSHEQIAQLERECALAQQRYTEQVQAFHQMEITCRDLRSRLHRQQRYTLQFKAALEKCLDVPTSYVNSPIADALEEQPSLAGDLDLHQNQSAKLGIPRSQPVQPWSASYEEEEKVDPTLQVWMNAFLAGQAGEVEGSMNLINPSNPSSEEIEDETPLGLSQYLPDNALFEQMPPIALDGLGVSGDEPPNLSYTIQRQVSSELDHAIGQGEEDRLSTPFRVAAMEGNTPNPLESDLELDHGIVSEQAKVSILQEPSPTEVFSTASNEDMASISGHTESNGLVAHSLASTPAVSPIAEDAADGWAEDLRQPDKQLELDEQLEPDVFNEMSEIAPVLYPTRSMKRRDSLAAVELPSFPRPS
ncbi:hypothetical protein ACN4EG_03310 [Alkalinema pantanalense CENA528]|uniref:hypothetical protein n=1 Tax=Alkalinema pantanalense TaxID=1620705 RepID=UPI003D6E048F